jgi:hypothetical protein
MVTPTEVPQVIGFDLLATENSPPPSLPTTLYYNPLTDAAAIRVTSTAPTRIYDAVSDRFLDTAASREHAISIGPDAAVILVEVPESATLHRQDGRLLAGDVVVDYVLPEGEGGQLPRLRIPDRRAAR